MSRNDSQLVRSSIPSSNTYKHSLTRNKNGEREQANIVSMTQTDTMNVIPELSFVRSDFDIDLNSGRNFEESK